MQDPRSDGSHGGAHMAWRWMTTAVRRLVRVPSLALVLGLVAACGGAALPPAQPTAAPAATAASLPAGTYTSRAFAPAVTVTLPEGWRNPTDSPAYWAIYPTGNDYAGIHLFHDPRAASQAETCPTLPEPGVGTLSTELSAWIRGLPGLDVSTPRMVNVGGLRGVEMDVQIASGWTFSCPFAEGLPSVPLFVGTGNDLRWVVAGSEKLRLSLLDVPGGGTVVVDVDAFDGSQWDTLLDAARPIVASMEFAAD